MRFESKRVVTLACWAVAAAIGCGDDKPADPQAAWEALMGDGDVSGIATATTAPPAPPPPRFCQTGDCAREPLAFWTMDDCNTNQTLLLDFAGASIIHPAFRAVSVACVTGASLQGVKLAGKDDIVYAPDQPDFIFDQGLTIAGVDQAEQPERHAEHRAQALRRQQLVHAGDRRPEAELRGPADERQAGRRRRADQGGPHDARRGHVRRQRARLYIDGALAAKDNGAGKIAPGAGPILIGNDADGRQFKGILDEIWLNNLAAPADAVTGLTCIRKAPVATLSPAMTPPTPPNTSVAFDLAITNPSGASCPADTFEFFGQLGYLLAADQTFGYLPIGPGQTVHVPINVVAFDSGVTGPIPFQYGVVNAAKFDLQATASATFVVAPPPPPTRTGCAPTPTAPVAPGGYYVNGNTVCTADGRAHTFHGVDRPSLEWIVDGRAHRAAGLPADGDLERERRAHRAQPGLLAVRLAVLRSRATPTRSTTPSPGPRWRAWT